MGIESRFKIRKVYIKMQIGTFADMATQTHIKQINRQKRIVFGERPSTISAQTLRQASLLNEFEQSKLDENGKSTTDANGQSQILGQQS